MGMVVGRKFSNIFASLLPAQNLPNLLDIFSLPAKEPVQ